MEKLKGNSRYGVEFFIRKGKEILIAATLPLLASGMVSISDVRSFATHIRNWLMLEPTNVSKMPREISSSTPCALIL
jgi:formate-dependent phosphoribosylglycinamide formyltransferase (GAR transformylase)